MALRLNDDQKDEFEALSRPLIKWINDNMHPHAHITITSNHVELAEGVVGLTIDDYILD